MNKRYGVISLFSLTDFCLLYIGISSVFPCINGYLGTIDTAICIGLNIVLLLVTLSRTSKCFSRDLDVLLLMVFLFYSIFIPYVSGNSYLANRYLGLLILLVGPHIYMLYEKSEQIERLKRIIILICIFAGITFVTTVIGLLTNPYLSRSIKSSGEITTSLKRSGIGGYELVYFCMLLGIALFYCFLQSKKNEYLIITGIVFLFLLLSNYMTAVFLFVFGCFLCFFLERNKKQRLIAFVSLILFMTFFDPIINSINSFIKSISPSGRIARFLSENSTHLLEGLKEEFVIDRLPTIQSSWNTIANSFGLGVVFSNNIDISFIGQHSFVIDSLAIFGLPMGILYLYLVFKDIKLPVSLIVSFIMLAIANNMTSSIGIAVCFIIPFITMANNVNQNKPEDKNE